MFVAEVERKEVLLSTDNITLANFVEKWLRDYAEHQLTPRGVEHYKYLLVRVLQALGHLKLTEITALHIMEFYNKLRKEGARKDDKQGGLSEQTIKHHHTVIRKVLNDAISWNLLTTNPASRIKAPKVEKKEVSFYDEEQTAQLLTALENEKPRFKIMVKLAIVTSCRRGEIIDFKWSDIDFEKKEVTIGRAISTVKGREQIIKLPKTEKPRKITLPKGIIGVLKDYKKYQNEERLKKGWDKTEWLFTGRYGELLYLSTSSRQFKKFIKRHNLHSITLHGLRHTHGTTLIAAGLDIRTVAHRLGHSGTSTTLDIYTHLLKSADQAAADVMDEVLEKSKATNHLVK